MQKEKDLTNRYCKDNTLLGAADHNRKLGEAKGKRNEKKLICVGISLHPPVSPLQPKNE
jgi:hypothetical protein